MASSVFEQHYGIVENVYNANGDLILTKASTSGDLAQELAALRSQISALPVEPQARAASIGAVDAAIAESQKSQPQRIEIQRHLETAASTLKNASNVAESSMKLAEMLAKMGKWVITFL